MKMNDLHDLFKLDGDLIEKYHICSGQGLEKCVENTWNIIKDLEITQSEYGYFAIDNRDIIPSVVGFFIKPELRNKSTIIKFWDDIEKRISGPYLTSIYTKNEPAMVFLSKKGKILEKTNTQCTFYFLGKR